MGIAAISDAENQEIYGYDLVARLGANLACAEQTAILEDRGQINIEVRRKEPQQPFIRKKINKMI